MTSLYQRTQEALVALVKRAQNDTLAPQERLGINHAREALSATLNAAERLLESEARDAISQKHSEVEYREAFARAREDVPKCNWAWFDSLTSTGTAREVVSKAHEVLLKNARTRRSDNSNSLVQVEVATTLLNEVKEMGTSAAEAVRKRGVLDEDMHAVIEKQIAHQSALETTNGLVLDTLESLTREER